MPAPEFDYDASLDLGVARDDYDALADLVEANLRAALAPEVIEQLIADVTDRVRRTVETRAHLDALGLESHAALGSHWLVPVDILARVLARETYRGAGPNDGFGPRRATYATWREATDLTHDAFLRRVAA